MKKYDYLIVGAGPFGATFAYEMNKIGKRVLVIDKRNHIAGNIYTENVEGINVHKYGAHIFHTNDEKLWKYVNKFAKFNNFRNSPKANYKGKLYSLPFNMNTWYELFGVINPDDAKHFIEHEVAKEKIDEPQNFEEQAIKIMGRKAYDTLVRGYTKKQWGRDPTTLPAFIIKRLPLRFTFDNNYFKDRFQGIPIGGYTQIVEKMLKGIEVRLNTDFFSNKDEFMELADTIIFTGPIDAFFNYVHGRLEYRSLRFDTSVMNKENHQGNAVINYTDEDVSYTRVIEHKHFEPDVKTEKTIVSYEYSIECDKMSEPYYPINDEKNAALYLKYLDEAKRVPNVIFCGRLGSYKYYDTNQVIEEALKLVKSEKKKIAKK